MPRMEMQKTWLLVIYSPSSHSPLHVLVSVDRPFKSTLPWSFCSFAVCRSTEEIYQSSWYPAKSIDLSQNDRHLLLSRIMTFSDKHLSHRRQPCTRIVSSVCSQSVSHFFVGFTSLYVDRSLPGSCRKIKWQSFILTFITVLIFAQEAFQIKTHGHRLKYVEVMSFSKKSMCNLQNLIPFKEFYALGKCTNISNTPQASQAIWKTFI